VQRLNLLPVALAILLCAGPAVAADAVPADAGAATAAKGGERLQVADPYLELHTGPGRGYPVFFVVGRDAWIEIELRSTDWYRVRSPEGKVGWVHRSQLGATLTTSGARRTFREVLIEDYLHRRVEMGAGWGVMRSDPMVEVWAGVRMGEAFSLEAAAGQVQGTFSGSNLWRLNVLADPWRELPVAPYFGIGLGKFINLPHASLVGATTTNSRMTDATAGIRWHVSQRLSARIDYTAYAVDVSDHRIEEFRAWTAGLSFFF
jgi:SH3-like domain-containing protein